MSWLSAFSCTVKGCLFLRSEGSIFEFYRHHWYRNEWCYPLLYTEEETVTKHINDDLVYIGNIARLCSF